MKKLLASLSLAASTAFAACPELYPEPLTVSNTVELCNSFYVSVYDTAERKVVFVSERIKQGSALHVERKNEFKADLRLGARAVKPSEYTGSGFDKGHMAPAGDSPDEHGMTESFLMSNMTPQRPQLNRGEWNRLEQRVRKMAAESKGDVYVVTIAEYKNKDKMNNVPIPSGYWKIVYIENSKIAYYAENSDTAKVIMKPGVSPRALLAR